MTTLVNIQNLYVRFTGGRTVYALNGVSFSVNEGEVLGLIGKSGSGKSVTLRALMRLLPPHKTIVAGSITAGGQDVMTLNPGELRALRGRVVSMIFQEPMMALGSGLYDRPADRRNARDAKV